MVWRCCSTVVSSFISDQVELSNIPNPAVCHTVCGCWMKPWISGLFPSFKSEGFDMSQLNVNCCRYRVRRALENYTLRNMVRFRANVCNFIDDLCGSGSASRDPLP